MSTFAITRDRRDTMRENMEAALLFRSDSAFDDLREKGRDYVGFSLLDMAKESLAAQGVGVRGLGADQVASLALRERFDGSQVASDFPSILANVARKSLRQAYSAWPQTFKAFSRRATAADFKQISRVQLNDVPALQKLNEKSEYHHANLTDSNQNYALATYGQIISISRKAIINDDTHAFTRIPALMGVAAAQTESDAAWGCLIGNQVMQADGLTLFHANHKNLATGGASALGSTSLSTARAEMRLQRGPQGTNLNLVPRFIAVPAALETTMNQNVVPVDIASATATTVVPDWVRSLVPIVESRLDANSTTAWYLFADPAQIDTIEYCYLEGDGDGVYTESKWDFGYDGMQIKARLDFAAAALDWRGLTKSTGV